MPLSKVLLVDDEPDIRRIAQLSLEHVGKLHVVQASCGRLALELAASEQPGVILLDVMMPVLDGPGTFALLRANPETAGIPVIFMTAKAQSAEMAHLEALGASGVISKPFDPMQLPSDVRRLLGKFPVEG